MNDRLERVGVGFALERGIFTWKRFGKGQSRKGREPNWRGNDGIVEHI